MGADVIPVTRGTLTVSSIRFYCEPSREGGLVLQLGAIAEIAVPRLRGFGLIARSELTSFELDKIGEIGRRILTSPFNMLSKEFEIAWAEAQPGFALEFLHARHLHSLRVEKPETREVPPRLFAVDGQPVRSLVRTFLSEELDNEASQLLAMDSDNKPHIAEPEERVEMKAAA
jgi:hypothetical protein